MFPGTRVLLVGAAKNYQSELLSEFNRFNICGRAVVWSDIFEMERGLRVHGHTFLISERG